MLQHLLNSFRGNHLSLEDYSKIPKGEFLIHPGAIWWHLHVPAHTQILEPIFFTISSKAYLEQTREFLFDNKFFKKTLKIHFYFKHLHTLKGDYWVGFRGLGLTFKCEIVIQCI